MITCAASPCASSTTPDPAPSALTGAWRSANGRSGDHDSTHSTAGHPSSRARTGLRLLIPGSDRPGRCRSGHLTGEGLQGYRLVVSQLLEARAAGAWVIEHRPEV